MAGVVALDAHDGLAGLYHVVRVGVRTQADEGIQRHNACHPNVGWCEATDMLFKNNPKIAGKYFGREFGVLKPGARCV